MLMMVGRVGDECNTADGDICNSEPPSHQLGGLGERCKLPHRGPGRRPRKLEIWCNLRSHKALQKCLIMFKSNQGLHKAKTLRGEKILSPGFLWGMGVRPRIDASMEPCYMQTIETIDIPQSHKPNT